jgi:hypothetical protein
LKASIPEVRMKSPLKAILTLVVVAVVGLFVRLNAAPVADPLTRAGASVAGSEGLPTFDTVANALGSPPVQRLRSHDGSPGLSVLDLLSRPAYATIPKVSKSFYYGPQVVWSTGSTTTPGLFQPLSDPMESRGFIDARVALEMSQEYNSCAVTSGVRFGNDGLTWNAAKQINAAAVTAVDTPQYDTGYTDLTALTGITVGAYIQFGVFVCNETGSTISICNATLRVEPKQLVR